MPLTDATCRNAPKNRPRKISDGGGLHLLVQPNGNKLWRLAYRCDGKQKLLALGSYPRVSLADARKGRERARDQVDAGVDPSQAKKEEKRKTKIAAANTFELVAREWFATQKTGWAESYASRVLSRLEEDIFPVLGKRPIAELEAPELLEVIRTIEGRGAVEMAKRVLQSCSRVFRYAIVTQRASRDPAADLRGALKPRRGKKHRAALREADLPAFLAKLSHYDGERQTQLALTFTLLTFVRTEEVRFSRKSEFKRLDAIDPLWRIPAERMKAKREHLVPLAPQAIEALKRIWVLSGDSPLLFPSPGKKGVMSENTMLFALYRMGYHGRATVHGFRTMASTILNEHGFNRDWIERQLAHAEEDEVRAAYNAADWLPERRRMLKWWADFLDGQRKVGLSTRERLIERPSSGGRILANADYPWPRLGPESN